MLERRDKILTLAKAMEATFSSSEWTEVGYLTATDDYIDGHPRLLRSLHWGDNDYKGNVIDAVAVILERDPKNLARLVEYEPIAAWMREHDALRYGELRSEVFGLEVPEVLPTSSTDSGLAALADAQTLLRTRGATSAVDRVHTGLHSFLMATCDAASIPRESTATPNELLKLLLREHPALGDLGPNGDEIRRLMRTSASLVDAMGTLRNRASLAHPNEELLDQEDALFVINLARSLLRFLDSKLCVSAREA